MTLRIRLSPERVQQKHHHLQFCSPLCVSLVGCHPHPAWVRSRQCPHHQRSTPRGLYILIQQAKLPRLRKKKVKIASVWKHCPLRTLRHTDCKLIKKRTKTTWSANNQKASVLASKAWVLLSNFTVIQIVEQLNTGAKKKKDHMYAVHIKTVK